MRYPTAFDTVVRHGPVSICIKVGQYHTMLTATAKMKANTSWYVSLQECYAYDRLSFMNLGSPIAIAHEPKTAELPFML